MQKRMGEAVARVARKVNDTVENKTDSLDLANCKLMTFPVGIYKAMRSVTEGIHRISLANNELKSITSRFVTTFSQLRELNLAGNYLHRLPEEITSLLHLRAIDLSRNRFRRFPEPLATVPSLETIDLGENEIAATCLSRVFTAPQGKAAAGAEGIKPHSSFPVHRTGIRLFQAPPAGLTQNHQISLKKRRDCRAQPQGCWAGMFAAGQSKGTSPPEHSPERVGAATLQNPLRMK
ncbi:leucine-rich repeat-containing protein 20 isoform X1 [Manacus candei]|uniref:leucine-rich repeat-containing protein 20 isoform X1 n=1 Tax=Manacus candei TaxID=415023 RepID=UPI002226C1D5|nr:leucine-rich repeat-containing protein 20 isoform X1 [Manacus candei]